MRVFVFACERSGVALALPLVERLPYCLSDKGRFIRLDLTGALSSEGERSSDGDGP